MDTALLPESQPLDAGEPERAEHAELLEEPIRLAWTQERWEEMAVLCDRMRSRFPGHAGGYSMGLAAARALGQLEAANALAGLAMELFPDDPQVWAESGLLALQGRRWTEAIGRFEALRTRFPDLASGYLLGAIAWREMGSLDDAADLADAAIARFPEEVALLIERAWIWAAKDDWEASANCWRDVRERFPGRPEGYAMGGMALRRLARFEAAQALIEDARERFPEDRSAAVEDAWIAFDQGNFLESHERWSRIRGQFPDHPEGYSMGTMVLLRAGLHDEAEALIALGSARFPDDPDVIIQSAYTAVERREWEEARRRWQRVCDRCPDREEGPNGLKSVELLRQLEGTDTDEEPDEGPTNQSRPRVACIMMQKDEELLLEPWLAYHGYLFGFENLIVYDNGSTLESVADVLRRYEAAGVVVIRDKDSPDDFINKGWILSVKIRELQRRRKYDVVFPLDCDEFVCITGEAGFSCNRSEINSYLAGLEPGTIYLVERSLTNQPGSSEIFRVMGHGKSVISMGRFKHMDHGFHQAELDGETTTYHPTRLVNIHLHNKPFRTLLEHARLKLQPFVDVDDPEALENFTGCGVHLKSYFQLSEQQYRSATGGWPLVRFPGFANLLAALMDFASFNTAWCRWEAEPPSQDLSAAVPGVIDFDGSFDARSYVEANPDVERAGLDPVIHYIEVGSREGRALRPHA
jgi:tetratricopeptide (TPR) repeat protein